MKILTNFDRTLIKKKGKIHVKNEKLTLAIAMATALAGCANIGDSYKASQQDYQNYAEITKQFNVKKTGGRFTMIHN